MLYARQWRPNIFSTFIRNTYILVRIKLRVRRPYMVHPKIIRYRYIECWSDIAWLHVFSLDADLFAVCWALFKLHYGEFPAKRDPYYKVHCYKVAVVVDNRKRSDRCFFFSCLTSCCIGCLVSDLPNLKFVYQISMSNFEGTGLQKIQNSIKTIRQCMGHV